MLRRWLGRILGISVDTDARRESDRSTLDLDVSDVQTSPTSQPIERAPLSISPPPSRSSLTMSTPSTLDSELENTHLNRPIVFDPALRQYTAHRGGEPQFDRVEHEARWQLARTIALHHVLQTIHASCHAEHLTLRGSALLRTWLGDRARRPGDLDWVVTPASWTLGQAESRMLIDGIIDRLRGSRASDTIEIPDQTFAAEEIWNYEKAPGQRVIVPWRCSAAELNGTIQLDFVFGETLPSPPIQTDVCIGDFSPISMSAASREQSLAWKLLWLSTDCYALGKDLYDAVLLAEAMHLPADLLRRTFEVSEDAWSQPLKHFTPEAVLNWDVEWEDFVKEYPHVTGTDQEWKQRLARAIEPLLSELTNA